jgi:hypothetical protein
MTQRERNLLALRMLEIDAELMGIAEGRVVDGDPATIEEALLNEQEEIEFKLGDAWFNSGDDKWLQWGAWNAKSLTRVASLLVGNSAVGAIFAGSWFTATKAWSPAMHTLGSLCFWVWWIPGLAGGVMNSLTLRRPWFLMLRNLIIRVLAPVAFLVAVLKLVEWLS